MSTLWIALAAIGVGVWLAHDGLVPQPSSPPRERSWIVLDRVRDWLAQADLPGVTVWHLLALCAAGCAAGALAGYMAFGLRVSAALGATLGALAVPLWLRTRHQRRRPARQRAIAVALERMRDTLGSGLTLDHAFQGLAADGPKPLQPAFRQFEAELPPHTDSFETAAERLRERLADSTWDMVTAGLLLHDEVGSGRFGSCLDHLARWQRADTALRDRLVAARARIVLTARVMAVLPAILLLLVRWWSPTATARTFESPLGQLLIAVCVAAIAGGYTWMLWLARLPDEERVLVRR
ncbi:MAG TPA: type II secretion system F family protein [Chloroflexota bacterium]